MEVAENILNVIYSAVIPLQTAGLDLEHNDICAADIFLLYRYLNVSNSTSQRFGPRYFGPRFSFSRLIIYSFFLFCFQPHSPSHDSPFDGRREFRLRPLPLGRVLVAPKIVERDPLSWLWRRPSNWNTGLAFFKTRQRHERTLSNVSTIQISSTT